LQTDWYELIKFLLDSVSDFFVEFCIVFLNLMSLFVVWWYSGIQYFVTAIHSAEVAIGKTPFSVSNNFYGF